MEKVYNIAVIVAGIDEEYQNNIINGINDFTREHSLNTSYFSAFGGILASKKYDIGEYNIYDLINFALFDGAILMTNTISDAEQKKKVIERVERSGIPAVVFDCGEYPEFYNVTINNFNAMTDMIRHVINRHDARVINYISGPMSNPEALARYNAFMSVMGEYGLTVENERIYFGEFRPQDGRDAIEKFLKSGLELPDAFVCANDAMALSAITALEKAGYKVPDDVIVTGFDYTYSARNFSPALSSVSRPLYDAGRKACEIICDVLSGKQPEKNVPLESSSVFSESCGCMVENASEFSAFKKDTFNRLEKTHSDIYLLNRITASLAETETTDENMAAISNFIGALECEKFCLCLCSEWEGSFMTTDTSDAGGSMQSGYSKIMTAPLIWQNGECHQVSSFRSEAMFPEQVEGGGNIFYFSPLHFRERCLGYYIIQNSDFPINSPLCHTLLMNISNSIENIRKLHHLNSAINELNRLYVIDPLCNIYNRNGFIKIADDMFKDCVANKSSVMLAFIDMDGLKFINDNYGHNEGDFAIQRLASIISECCDVNSICARFGGDEFVVFGANKDEKDVEELEAKVEAKLVSINNIVRKPYKISASIGAHVCVVDETSTLYGIIHTADEKMYEIKKQKKSSRSYQGI